MTSLGSAPVYSRERSIKRAPLPFTTIQDDSDLAPVLKLATSQHRRDREPEHAVYRSSYLQ
jgi:hypothetical protein